MKVNNPILTALLVIFSIGGLSAQQIVNITTGQGVPGQFNDPIWLAKDVSNWQTNSASITNNMTATYNSSTGVTLISQNVLTNECGNWITSVASAPDYCIPSTITDDGYNDIFEIGLPPVYAYIVNFEVTSCLFNPAAQLNIEWMAGINGIKKILLNDEIIWEPSYPGEAWHEAPISLYTNVDVLFGQNKLEVIHETDLSGDYSAIMICGEIIISDLGPLPVPQNTFCCDAPAGEILSWSPTPGAEEYEIVVKWNDTDCNSIGPYSAVTTYTTNNNVFCLSNTSTPHSWKVRAKNAYGCYSNYSDKECACSYCAPPNYTQCEFDGVSYNLAWSIDPNVTSYEVDVKYHDTLCCKSKYMPSLSTFSVDGNTLTLSDVKDCFSWRVRSHCGEGKISAWTEYECSCPYEVGKASESPGPHLLLDPNPSREFVSFHFEEENTSIEQSADLVIINSSGKVMHQSKIQVNEKMDINVQSMISGIYICKIIRDGAVIASEKLIIQ